MLFCNLFMEQPS